MGSVIVPYVAQVRGQLLLLPFNILKKLSYYMYNNIIIEMYRKVRVHDVVAYACIHVLLSHVASFFITRFICTFTILHPAIETLPSVYLEEK